MRRCSVLAIVVAAVAGGAAPAAAEPVALAPVTAAVPIAAHGGWVVWSAPVTGGWGLNAWHAGVVTSLPVAARQQPFDVDLGTDAGGHTVATFSRCTQIPTTGPGLLPPKGEGCRVRVLDLASGRERAAGVPEPKGTSDTMPSMWRGRIAFARRDPRHDDVEQVLLWSPDRHRLTRLRHGALPSKCPYPTGCKGLARRASVLRLDLGARLVAFQWAMQAPGVIGWVGYELRANRLEDGHSFLVASGFAGEVCTGGTDSTAPVAPALAGDVVWYARSNTSCHVSSLSLARFDTRTRRTARGALSGRILTLARGSGQLYAIVAPTPPPGETAARCDAPGAPCMLERIDAPSLVPRRYRPQPPFFT